MASLTSNHTVDLLQAKLDSLVEHSCHPPLDHKLDALTNSNPEGYNQYINRIVAEHPATTALVHETRSYGPSGYWTQFEEIKKSGSLDQAKQYLDKLVAVKGKSALHDLAMDHGVSLQVNPGGKGLDTANPMVVRDRLLAKTHGLATRNTCTGLPTWNISAKGCEVVTANLSVGRVQERIVDGKRWLVAPATMIVPGVLVGSRGPLYYSPEEVAKNHAAWNDVPITVYHPYSTDGQASSVYDGDVLERQGVGVIKSPRINNVGKLQGQAWLDSDKLMFVSPQTHDRLMKGEPVELSTGLFNDSEPAQNGANYNGRPYEASVRNIRPDHLAILPDMKGACSVSDGCGVLVNEQTKNAGPNQPRHAEKGHYLSHGAGTGKGEVHQAAKCGFQGCKPKDFEEKDSMPEDLEDQDLEDEDIDDEDLEDEEDLDDEDLAEEEPTDNAGSNEGHEAGSSTGSKATIQEKLVGLLSKPTINPFVSEAQRRYLWSQEPEIAEAWAHGEHTSDKDHKMPKSTGKDVKGPLAKAERKAQRAAHEKAREKAKEVHTATANAWSDEARAAAAEARKAAAKTRSGASPDSQQARKASASAWKATSSADPEGKDSHTHGVASRMHNEASSAHMKAATSEEAAGNSKAGWAHRVAASRHYEAAHAHIGTFDPEAPGPERYKAMYGSKGRSGTLNQESQDGHGGASFNHEEGEATMANDETKLTADERETVIDGLIGCDGCFSEGDRPLLNEASDSTLALLSKQSKSAQSYIANAMPKALAEALAKKGKGPLAEDDEDEEEEAKEEEEETTKNLTEEEWLANAPQPIRNRLHLLAEIESREREGLIGKLTANVEQGKRKEVRGVFQEMDLGTLRTLGSAVVESKAAVHDDLSDRLGHNLPVTANTENPGTDEDLVDAEYGLTTNRFDWEAISKQNSRK